MTFDPWHMACRVVGGLDVLSAMERMGTDDEDRPLDEIKITATAIFVDPFQEAEEEVGPAPSPSPCPELCMCAPTAAGRGGAGEGGQRETAQQQWQQWQGQAPSEHESELGLEALSHCVVSAQREEGGPKVYRSGVGKYISPSAGRKRARLDLPAGTSQPQAGGSKKGKVKASLGDFSAW